MSDKVNLAAAFAQIAEHWRPRVAAELNGQEVKLVKVKGEFVWHHHDAEDELFLVVAGRLLVEFRDRTVALGPGEMLVIPKGVEHRPVAGEEVQMLVFEPAGVRNTGNVVHETLTAPTGTRPGDQR